MTKADLIENLAQELGMSKAMASRVVDKFLGGIEDALSRGEKVTVSGFGTFWVGERKARMGRNPATGDPMYISGRIVPKFRAGLGLKRAVR